MTVLGLAQPGIKKHRPGSALRHHCKVSRRPCQVLNASVCHQKSIKTPLRPEKTPRLTSRHRALRPPLLRCSLNVGGIIVSGSSAASSVSSEPPASLRSPLLRAVTRPARREQGMETKPGEKGAEPSPRAKRNGARYGTPACCPRSFGAFGAPVLRASSRLEATGPTGPAGPEARRKRQRSRACTTHSPKVREVPSVTREKVFALMLLKNFENLTKKA